MWLLDNGGPNGLRSRQLSYAFFHEVPAKGVTNGVSGNWRAQARPRSDHPREAAKASANLSPTSEAEAAAE